MDGEPEPDAPWFSLLWQAWAIRACLALLFGPGLLQPRSCMVPRACSVTVRAPRNLALIARSPRDRRRRGIVQIAKPVADDAEGSKHKLRPQSSDDRPTELRD